MRSTAAALLSLGLFATALPAVASTTDAPTPAMEAAAACTAWSFDGAEERPAESTPVTRTDLRIEMSDGVELLADLIHPEGEGPWPVVVTTTPYSKNALGPEPYFAERGYAHLIVDVRGTGASEGTWQVLGEREHRDVFEVLTWAAEQDFSTGETAMYGASYMAITQLLGAHQRPPGLKALFPIVPMADSYRDITFVGGQTNLAFIPIWFGLVTGTGLLPSGSWFSDPEYAAGAMADHLIQPTTVQGPLIAGGVTKGEQAYDSAWYDERAPIEMVDAIDVPVFMTGGLNDLFQRGEPLLYERMKDNTLVKFVQGPWGHLDGSSGAGLPADGVPAYLPLATAWFDRWVLDVDNGAECFPPVTQYHWGSEAYEQVPDWPHPDLTPELRYLGEGGALTVEPPTGEQAGDVLPQVYGNGLCSRSTSQWLMGATDRTPCQTDNTLTELAELTYTTPPLDEDALLNGPIAASLWVTTTAPEAVVVARLTVVSPDGTSREVSTGILTASFREVDVSRSRFVDGIGLQPWHPYTEESVQPVTDEPMRLDIEIFPTSVRVPAGSSLRLAVGTSDFPHAVSPLPDAIAQTGGLLTVLHDNEHPSSVAIPFVRAASAAAPAPAPAPDPQTGDDGGLPATGGGSVLAAAVLLLGSAASRRRLRGR